MLLWGYGIPVDLPGSSNACASRQGIAMKKLTFQVLEGVDKGRVFRDLMIPVTLGREEGNALRLNDERVSRFHAKIQQEDGDIIITDLESTNGTRVNGSPIQIRRLKPGDQIGLGRSTLLFGTLEEIAARKTADKPTGKGMDVPQGPTHSGTILNDQLGLDFDLDSDSCDTVWARSEQDAPPLPQKITTSQAARLAEIFDFLHRGISGAIENADRNEEGSHVTLGFSEWQTILAVQGFLARYMRAVADPEHQLE
jgi:pSer/pThr/pTyr-binding forkhead associated (FHA) protein